MTSLPDRNRLLLVYHPKYDRAAITRLAHEEARRCSDVKQRDAAEIAFAGMMRAYQDSETSPVPEGGSLDEFQDVFCDEFDNYVPTVMRQRSLPKAVIIFGGSLLVLSVLLTTLLVLLPR